MAIESSDIRDDLALDETQDLPAIKESSDKPAHRAEHRRVVKVRVKELSASLPSDEKYVIRRSAGVYQIERKKQSR